MNSLADFEHLFFNQTYQVTIVSVTDNNLNARALLDASVVVTYTVKVAGANAQYSYVSSSLSSSNSANQIISSLNYANNGYAVTSVADATVAGPTSTPTFAPTNTPTFAPTVAPSAPSSTPTVAPSAPSSTPTVAPSAPSSAPTATPTFMPTFKPTFKPTASPTATPTAKPTATPSFAPTATPSFAPTATPTAIPTATPTAIPTATPTAIPTATPTASPSSKIPSSCFAGSETVTMESGELKAISSVRVGDRVLAANTAGKTVVSPVVYVPHGANKENALFVHIATNNRDVKMTNNHILPAGICGSTLPLVYASQVTVGDCIQTVSGQEKVSSIEVVHSEGVYTIVTNEEYVIVNGIIASPFGANHMMANMFYNIHRVVYTLFPVLLTSTLLHTANEGLGLLIPLFGASAKTY